jgi:hypothetical protein
LLSRFDDAAFENAQIGSIQDPRHKSNWKKPHSHFPSFRDLAADRLLKRGSIKTGRRGCHFPDWFVYALKLAFRVPFLAPGSGCSSPSFIQNSQSYSKRSPTRDSTFASKKFPATTTILFHDFLPFYSRTISQNILSAWLTSALSVWKIWTSFLTQFTMIFEMREKRRRHRSQSFPHHIPEKSTTNKLSLLLNPAVIFYTMNV